jgi:hypothetical protein
MNLLRKLALPLFLAAAVSLQSCKSDSTGPDNNVTPVETTKPTTGSTYTYTRTTTPEGGSPQTSTVTYTVASADVQFQGKSNVFVYESADESRVLSIADNGNVSVLTLVVKTDGIDTTWITLPVTGSGGSSNVTTFDLEIDFLGQVIRTVVKSSASLDRTENVTINGQSYEAKVIKVSNVADVSIAGISQGSETSNNFYWWVPAIGYYSKAEEVKQENQGGEMVSTSRTEIISSFDLN